MPVNAYQTLAYRLIEIANSVVYGSDMRLFTNHAQIPATHYGPGDVGIPHAANEFVPIEEVVTATKVIANTITHWCGVGKSSY